MVLGDTSFWLALALPPHNFHAPAQRWFGRLTAEPSVLFCRATQHSFLRLLTTRAVMSAYSLSPMTNAAAWDMYDALRADPRIAFAAEPPELESRWRQVAVRATASPKLWMDGYLAAFAIAGGHGLVTTDQGFAQFKNLQVTVLT